jgi:hypothetical protein
MKWTTDRQLLLADLSAQGYSAADIAAQIGETKNAVANTMTRYGLYAGPGRDRKAVSLRKRQKRSRISLAPVRWMESA